MMKMKRINSYRDLELEKERLNQKVEFDILKLENEVIQLKYQLFNNVLKTVYDFIKPKKE